MSQSSKIVGYLRAPDGSQVPLFQISEPLRVKVVQDSPLLARIDSWDTFAAGRAINNQAGQVVPVFPEPLSARIVIVRPDKNNTDAVWLGDQSISVEGSGANSAVKGAFPLYATDQPVRIPATKGKGRPHMTSPTANQILYWCVVVG